MICFGPSGNSESFYNEGYKNSEQMPAWLYERGLNAYEYSCTKGVKLSKEKAEKIGAEAKKYNIALSVHAPYYISLSTDDEEKRKRSIEYILKTLEIAKFMGADRIVVHSGSCAKMPRERAFENSAKTLLLALDKAAGQGLSHIHICPETMGKINQLGTLDEVLKLCLLDDSFIPTIDFGHLHTRGLGALNTKDDFKKVLDSMEQALGSKRMKNFHAHFSRIEFTAGGEKKHHTFKDTQYGPDFDYLAELLYERKLTPRIICESMGTMAEDAKIMKNMYFRLVKQNEENNLCR